MRYSKATALISPLCTLLLPCACRHAGLRCVVCQVVCSHHGWLCAGLHGAHCGGTQVLQLPEALSWSNWHLGTRYLAARLHVASGNSVECDGLMKLSETRRMLQQISCSPYQQYGACDPSLSGSYRHTWHGHSWVTRARAGDIKRDVRCLSALA